METEVTSDEMDLAEYTIREYFDKAPGWSFAGHLGGGAFGNVFQVKRGDESFALKVSYGSMALFNRLTVEERRELLETEQIINEAAYLARMRGCSHILKTFRLPDDPLANPSPPGIVEHGMDAWVLAEMLPNGSFDDFNDKFRRAYPGIRLMPNRVLWWVFMCMLRICLDLGFHSPNISVRNTSLEGLQRGIPGGTIHGDLHGGNVMVGRIIPNFQAPEHSITPLFKAIDLGMAEEISWYSDGTEPSAAQRNVKDVADLLAYEMFTRFRYKELDQLHGDATMGNVTFRSDLGGVWLQRDIFERMGLDIDLLEVLVRCSADEPARRPKLTDLAIQVRQEVMCRDAAFYNFAEVETDKFIRNMMYQLLP
jgi:serine/threonine protein kinase